jgi:hypothetical protein
MERPKSKNWFWITIGSLALIVVFVIQILDHFDAKRLERELAVTDLPAGATEAWEAFVSNTLLERITPIGRMIRVRGYLSESLGDELFVPLGSQYSIVCSLSEVSITLGVGEQAQEVTVFGPLADNGHSQNRPPSLTVHPRSIAAQKLRAKICDRVKRYMLAINRPR